MNVYVFWILFLGLWAIVPLMIIKGRKDESQKVKTVPEVKAKKKGWFKQIKILELFLTIYQFYEKDEFLKAYNF